MKRDPNRIKIKDMTTEQYREYRKNKVSNWSVKKKANAAKRRKEWHASNRILSRCHSMTTNVKNRWPGAHALGDLQTAGLLRAWAEPLYGRDCPYCGELAYSIDHIIPLSAGGVHATYNLQVICVDCNIMKHAHSEEEFLTKVKRIYENMELMS